MNDKGSYDSRRLIAAMSVEIENGTYEDNRHHSEYHDCLALTHCLLTLLHGLISLNNAGLLLLEAE